MRIERAAAHHIPAVAALEHELFPLGLDESAFYRLLGDGHRALFVALEGEELLGYIYYGYVLDEGSIGDVAVAPSARRRGAGTALVERACADAAEKALAFLTLEVRESNEGARALYEKCGFEVVGLRKNYYEKPRENAVLMTRYFRSGDETL